MSCGSNDEARSTGQARLGSLPIVRAAAAGAADLFSIRREYKSVYNEVFECGFIKQSRGDDHECIEPSSRLIQSFGDEIGGETVREILLVLKWIVQLRVRHRTTLEPTIEHLLDSSQHSKFLASLRRYGDMIDFILKRERERERERERKKKQWQGMVCQQRSDSMRLRSNVLSCAASKGRHALACCSVCACVVCTNLV